MPAITHGLIEASENEQPDLRKINEMLRVDYQVNNAPRLISSSGEIILLPESVFSLLRDIIHLLMRGRAVKVVSLAKELSTQEAADILNVSRPSVVKLLEEGKIPFVRIGKHRRVLLNDLVEYKKLIDAERSHRLSELTQMAQDLGLYNE